MSSESDLDRLIGLFSKLPALGPRSAKRLVLYLINNRQTAMMPLIETMQEVSQKVKHCHVCNNLDITNICSICTDLRRDNSLICVVEEVGDLWAIEKSRIFNGKYHILGGTLSAIGGKGPEDLKIERLVTRIRNQNIEEIILATNSTLDGQTTAYYLAEVLQNLGVKISKLAYGMPIGSELDYLDEGTLNIAFKSRSNF